MCSKVTFQNFRVWMVVNFQLENGWYSTLDIYKTKIDRVLFQNADGNINAGVFLHDPDVEFREDFYWFHLLAERMFRTLNSNSEFTYLNEESVTLSCYAELHRYHG